jgi:hypothetical protein
MRKRLTVLVLVGSLLLAAAAGAQEHHHVSPYAGETGRAIKSLSAEDIAELRRGGGWGLARAAELNGVPGPAHLLELKDEIPLDAGQIAALEALFAAMQGDAIAVGEELIALETALDRAFRERTITAAKLLELTTRIGATQARLRYIHLAAHLQTPALLSEAQIARYNALRGYAAEDCPPAPAGHDPALWRRHQGCD